MRIPDETWSVDSWKRPSSAPQTYRATLICCHGHCASVNMVAVMDSARGNLFVVVLLSQITVLNLVIVKKGENDLPGLTDIEKQRMSGPKRTSRIRKPLNLAKEDDVCKRVGLLRYRDWSGHATDLAKKVCKDYRG
ncbi:hypothetical protein Nepgr_002010 [Nepenthes gracilis]|uniref:Uncharacterized protein n=1 Tax=Nepenthes gracilis TaxID=150966 RepID=A0AAD3RXY0_NEPGR|nr:hypothetical protein Nepgr_002010 [Nepenthes gracilis]